MNINDPKYLEDTFIMRNADADGYDRPDFTELVDVKVVTAKSLEEYLGEYSLQNGLKGSIIYKCTPVFIVTNETVLKSIDSINNNQS
jgi:hypothetical protein